MPRPPLQWFLLGTLFQSFLPLLSNAFYLPGAAPHDYHEGEEVKLFVNALTPMLAGTDNAKLVSLSTHKITSFPSANGPVPSIEISRKLYISMFQLTY